MTSTLVREAWFSLQRNREQYLARMTTQSVIQDLENAAALWLEHGSTYMQMALDLEPERASFSKQTVSDGLQSLFKTINAPQLESWVEQDLGHVNRLDDFCASSPERATGRRAKAVGPATLAHVTAGNVPPATVMCLVGGFLVRAAQFVKCASGASLIPRLFAHSLRKVNPHLGACVEVAEWPHKRSDLQEALLQPAECVTVTGGDETVAAIRNAVPVSKRFVGFGHKVSFAFLTTESLASQQIEPLVAKVAEDICAWNQLGCLSPHVVYVEEGGAINAETFAGHLATALAVFETRNPRGILPREEAATIRSRRSFYEVRAANSRETKLWQSEGSTAWTVVYESDPQFQTSCLNRFVYVKGVSGLESVLQGADRVRHQVSTVGLAASAARASQLAGQLADWGVTRICPIGSMQQPPAAWRHDGRPALNELVRWTDWEP